MPLSKPQSQGAARRSQPHDSARRALQASFSEPYAHAAPPRAEPRRLDWRKRMSDSIAYALLVYTGLQIFVTIGALRDGSASMLPYLALILLIAAIVPACRRFERRWNRLSDAAAADPALIHAFRRDNLGLWLLAIGLPFGLAGLFRLLGMLIGS